MSTLLRIAIPFLCSLSFTLSWQIVFAQQANSQSSEGQRYWKGNLHTHSLWSDGTDFPEMITKWYRDRDYHFLSLTDHNILSRGEKWMNIEEVIRRGERACLENYQENMGAGWVEFRISYPQPEKDSENDEPDDEGQKTTGAESVESAPLIEVRLKTLEEVRSQFEEPGKFILVEGEEITDSVNRLPVHMNAINLDEILRPMGGDTVREAIQNNLRQAAELSRKNNRPIMVHLNHPNFGWGVSAEDLAAVTAEKFFEIYNGHPGVRQLGDESHPPLEKMWDIINTLRITRLDAAPIFGLGTDDSHEYHGRPGSQPGRAWVMVKADELTPDKLIDSMNRGEFYSSSGVELEAVEFDSQTGELSIKIAAEEGVTYETQFIGTPLDTKLLQPRAVAQAEQNTPQKESHAEQSDTDENDTTENTDGEDQSEPAKEIPWQEKYSDDVGKVLAVDRSTYPKYTLTGNELYVRAVIKSSRPHPNPSMDDQFEQAWTQPVGWQAHISSSGNK